MRIVFETLAVVAITLWLLIALVWSPPLHAQPPSYQVYKVSYGCLYVVTTQGGGVSAVVTPSVQGDCK